MFPPHNTQATQLHVLEHGTHSIDVCCIPVDHFFYSPWRGAFTLHCYSSELLSSPLLDRALRWDEWIENLEKRSFASLIISLRTRIPKLLSSTVNSLKRWFYIIKMPVTMNSHLEFNCVDSVKSEYLSWGTVPQDSNFLWIPEPCRTCLFPSDLGL